MSGGIDERKVYERLKAAGAAVSWDEPSGRARWATGYEVTGGTLSRSLGIVAGPEGAIARDCYTTDAVVRVALEHSGLTEPTPHEALQADLDKLPAFGHPVDRDTLIGELDELRREREALIAGRDELLSQHAMHQALIGDVHLALDACGWSRGALVSRVQRLTDQLRDLRRAIAAELSPDGNLNDRELIDLLRERLRAGAVPAVERQLGIEQSLHAAAIRRADGAEAQLRLVRDLVTALAGDR